LCTLYEFLPASLVDFTKEKEHRFRDAL